MKRIRKKVPFKATNSSHQHNFFPKVFKSEFKNQKSSGDTGPLSKWWRFIWMAPFQTNTNPSIASSQFVVSTNQRCLGENHATGGWSRNTRTGPPKSCVGGSTENQQRPQQPEPGFQLHQRLRPQQPEHGQDHQPNGNETSKGKYYFLEKRAMAKRYLWNSKS